MDARGVVFVSRGLFVFGISPGHIVGNMLVSMLRHRSCSMFYRMQSAELHHHRLDDQPKQQQRHETDAKQSRQLGKMTTHVEEST